MRSPFQMNAYLTWAPDAPNASNFDLVIPSGKRLEIHQISGLGNMPSGVRLTWVQITTSVGPSNVGPNNGSIFALPQFAGNWPPPGNDVPDQYTFSQHVLAFAEGPDPAQILVSRSTLIPSGQPQGEVNMTVSGYLVDL